MKRRLPGETKLDILYVLSQHPQGCITSEIATVCKAAFGTIGKHGRWLAEHGYVARAAKGGRFKNAVTWVLTPKGRKALADESLREFETRHGTDEWKSLGSST